MARSSLSGYYAASRDSRNRLFHAKGTLGVVQLSVIMSHWMNTPVNAPIPSTAAVPTRATFGALGQANPVANPLRLAPSEMTLGGSTVISHGAMFLCDRLSHQGGLSGIVTTPQTTNLPTAPLTRFTDGEHVIMCAEVYLAIGTTTVDITASYTNQAGVAGRTSHAVGIGGGSFNQARTTVWLPPQDGDYGVRSVESVTLSATTGTAGNFGITLFKPLYVFPKLLGLALQQTYDPVLHMGQLTEIPTDACLYWLDATGASGYGNYVSEMAFVED